MTTPTNDRQTSERERHLSVHTELRDGHNIAQTMDVLGEITRRFVRLSAQQLEDKVREGLIALGWTPPGHSAEAEIAQLKDVRDAYARKADALMEERDRLRAENEALRTVTHTCTECFEGQIQNFDGTFRACEHCGGTMQRQSFIRSKESRRG